MTSNLYTPTNSVPRPLDDTELRVVTFLHGAGPQMPSTISESLWIPRNLVEYALLNLKRANYVRLAGLGLYGSTNIWNPDLDPPRPL